MTDAFHGWGIERSNAAGGPPFLVGYVFSTRKAAQDEIVAIYGGNPHRAAALRRHRSQEGVRAVRVVMRPFGTGGGGR